jgi:hypothetical protein
MLAMATKAKRKFNVGGFEETPEVYGYLRN